MIRVFRLFRHLLVKAIFCPLFSFKKFVLVTVKNTVRVRVSSRVRARVLVRVRLGLGSGLQ